MKFCNAGRLADDFLLAVPACCLGRLAVAESMAGQSRLLNILLLYSEADSAFSADEIAARLGATLSTTYRDLQKLRQHGFIEYGIDDRFILGGRISILDRIARTTSPLLAAGMAEMKRLSAQTGLTVTLTRLYDNAVIGLGHVDGDRELSIGYERGQVVPLFRGCTGKVILGAMPWRSLRKVFDANPREIAAAGLGETWEQFRATARSFSRQPFLWTEGEFVPDNVAIATVLAGPTGSPLGSMTIIMRKAAASAFDRAEIERELIHSRRSIEESLARQPLAG